SGSEVRLIVEAAKELSERGFGVRVVSMPSWELFEEQEEKYKDEVLPKTVKNRVAVEAGSSMGWHKYTGDNGSIIAIDTFGGSAPGKELFKKFNITTEKVVEEARNILDK